MFLKCFFFFFNLLEPLQVIPFKECSIKQRLIVTVGDDDDDNDAYDGDDDDHNDDNCDDAVADNDDKI